MTEIHDELVLRIRLGDEESARLIMRDIHFRMTSPFAINFELINELIDNFKRHCLLPFFRKFEPVRYMQIRVGFCVGGNIIIGLSKESLWSDEIVEELENFLDVKYGDISERVRYDDDKVFYEKRFKINNPETRE